VRGHDWNSDDHAEDRDIAAEHAAAAGQRTRNRQRAAGEAGSAAARHGQARGQNGLVQSQSLLKVSGEPERNFLATPRNRLH